MTSPPVTDQQPITASDPRVQQILAMIQAKAAQSQVAPIPSDPQTATQIAPVPTPQYQQPSAPTPMQGQVNQLLNAQQAPAPPAPSLPPMQGPGPQIAPPAAPNVSQAPTKPGPVKSFLQSLVSGLGSDIYAGSQGALQKLGLPTDYEKQQNAAKLAISQQQADDMSAYRQAQTGPLLAKANQLDFLNQSKDIAPDDTSVLAQFRGMKGTTVGAYQNLQKISAQLSGKQTVAQIGADARTDVAQTTADSRERLANAQLAVRQAVADRNYGLAAQRLSLAGGNQNIRQLEYRMRAYGTGADGQPLPGVEFDANGRPIGTATQVNVRPTANARNAGERAETMQDIATRIQGALNDPDIRAGVGPVMGRINDIKGQAGVLDGPLAELRNDLVSYGAFQSGLHPVRGIGGLQYFDKVMGGLGQTPDQLLAKINSNSATGASVLNVARQGVASPSAPPVPHTTGGWAAKFGGVPAK